MDLSALELQWKECYTKDFTGKVTYFRELIASCKGTTIVNGYPVVRFRPANDDAEDLLLRPESVGESTYVCLQWDSEKSRWINLGVIYPVNEWGNWQFSSYWDECAIRLTKTGEIVPLVKIFERQLGERYEGVLFEGKGVLEGLYVILRLDTATRLDDYYDDQKCYRYDKEAREWQEYGTLLKAIS